MTSERFSLKDHLFNREKVEYLSGQLGDAVVGFDQEAFESAVMDKLPELELKERIAWIAEVLRSHLDPNFDRAATQILDSLPPPLDPDLADDDFGDFIIAPFGKYVEDNGRDHYKTSMDLLRQLTMRFSMEGSVRPFINDHPDKTLEMFAEWAHDENYHVRRLVSESTRPTLPWAPRIDLDIHAPLPLLDVLHSDQTRYVTRSVANHLNDISKIKPEVVLERLSRWGELGVQEPRELRWMTNHALRTLIKKGDPDAMRFLGYSPDPAIDVEILKLSESVVAGEFLEFELSISARGDERVILDYVVDFIKKSGESKPKVFKLKRLSLAGGETVSIKKRQRMKADATTFTLYPGQHTVTFVANGTPVANANFEIADP